MPRRASGSPSCSAAQGSSKSKKLSVELGLVLVEGKPFEGLPESKKGRPCPEDMRPGRRPDNTAYLERARHRLLEPTCNDEYGVEMFHNGYYGMRYIGIKAGGDALTPGGFDFEDEIEIDYSLGALAMDEEDWSDWSDSLGTLAWRGRLRGDAPEAGSSPQPELFLRRLHATGRESYRQLTACYNGLAVQNGSIIVHWATGRVVGVAPSGFEVLHAANLSSLDRSAVLLRQPNGARAIAILPEPGSISPIDHDEADHVFLLSAFDQTVLVTVGGGRALAWARKQGRWWRWAQGRVPFGLAPTMGGITSAVAECEEAPAVLVPCNGRGVLCIRGPNEWEKGRMIIDVYDWGQDCTSFSPAPGGLLGVSRTGVWAMTGRGNVCHVISPPETAGVPLAVLGTGPDPLVVCTKATVRFRWPWQRILVPHPLFCPQVEGEDEDDGADDGELDDDDDDDDDDYDDDLGDRRHWQARPGIFVTIKLQSELSPDFRGAAAGTGVDDEEDLVYWLVDETGAGYGLELVEGSTPIDMRELGAPGGPPPAASLVRFSSSIAQVSRGTLEMMSPLQGTARFTVVDRLDDGAIAFRSASAPGKDADVAATACRDASGAVRLRVVQDLKQKDGMVASVHTVEEALPAGPLVGCSVSGLGRGDGWMVALASGDHVFVLHRGGGGAYRHARFRVGRAVTHTDFETDGRALWLWTDDGPLRVTLHTGASGGTLRPGTPAEVEVPEAGGSAAPPPLAEPLSAGATAFVFGADAVASTRLGADGEWTWVVRRGGATSLVRHDGHSVAGPAVPAVLGDDCTAVWQEEGCCVALLHHELGSWTAWTVRPPTAGAPAGGAAAASASSASSAPAPAARGRQTHRVASGLAFAAAGETSSRGRPGGRGRG